MQKQDTALGLSDTSEVERRVPKTGIFNDLSIGILTAAFFGAIGYLSGKFLGRLGDDVAGNLTKEELKRLTREEIKALPPGRGEYFGKWFGGGALALIGASVGIRHSREARQQVTELAQRSVELERTNEALASVYTQPVGSIIMTENAPKEIPVQMVEGVASQGVIAEKTQQVEK